MGPVLCWLFKGVSGWEVNPVLKTFALVKSKTALTLDESDAPVQ